MPQPSDYFFIAASTPCTANAHALRFVTPAFVRVELIEPCPSSGCAVAAAAAGDEAQVST
jgi:hypothetical protein